MKSKPTEIMNKTEEADFIRVNAKRKLSVITPTTNQDMFSGTGHLPVKIVPKETPVTPKTKRKPPTRTPCRSLKGKNGKPATVGGGQKTTYTATMPVVYLDSPEVLNKMYEELCEAALIQTGHPILCDIDIKELTTIHISTGIKCKWIRASKNDYDGVAIGHLELREVNGTDADILDADYVMGVAGKMMHNTCDMVWESRPKCIQNRRG